MLKIEKYINESLSVPNDWIKYRRTYSTVFSNPEKKVKLKVINCNIFAKIGDNSVHLPFWSKVKIRIKLFKLDKYLVAKLKEVKDYQDTLEEQAALGFIDNGNVAHETPSFSHCSEDCRKSIETYVKLENKTLLNDILNIVESQRMKVIKNKLDPSWTEHFAEIIGKIQERFKDVRR